MKNVMPFPLQTNIAKQKEEKPKQQQFSYIKMTIAVVVGNVIAVAGLFVMFLIFLNMTSSIID
tara:strand:- start:179 stop:367 length:189 start_codon:yes stop_codon:yes gene_type:complete